jgi:hypothetical protein
MVHEVQNVVTYWLILSCIYILSVTIPFALSNEVLYSTAAPFKARVTKNFMYLFFSYTNRVFVSLSLSSDIKISTTLSTFDLQSFTFFDIPEKTFW